MCSPERICDLRHPNCLAPAATSSTGIIAITAAAHAATAHAPSSEKTPSIFFVIRH